MLTLSDLDKAADVYEALIEKCVLEPSAENARVMHDAMRALDCLGHIRNDVRRMDDAK